MCTLYESILSLCNERNIKGGKMCVDLGLSKSLMSDLKSGRKKGITAETAQKIANYFHVSVDRVLNGAETEKASASETGHGIPHAQYREILAEGGMRILLDADAKLPEEHLEEIVEFIKMKQRKYGR